MSKIKVNELESKTENTNIKLTPVGTGVVEVKGAGGNDGTVELKTLTGNNGVKLKSPPHSAGQSYTLTLPDNNVEADKFLRVKSKTGSGNTATGQLECATLVSSDLTQLNANNLTSGTIPTSVLPTSFAASAGAGLQLVTHTQISNTPNVYSVDFYPLDDNTMYRLVIKQLMYTNQISGYGGQGIYLLTSSGTFSSGATGTSIAYMNMHSYSGWNTSSYANYLNLYTGASNSHNFTGVFEFSTRASTGWGTFSAMLQGAEESFTYGYLGQGGGSGNHPRMYGIRFASTNGYAIDEADILLYKYVES